MIGFDVDIHYHDMPIITGAVKLFNVFIGDFSSTPSLRETVDLMDYFGSHLGNSSWYRTVGAYYQVNGDGSRTYASSTVEFIRSININYSNPLMELTEEAVQFLLTDAVVSGTIPNDESTVLAVMFSGAYSFPGWLGTWCAGHSAFYMPDGSSIVKYFVIGDPSTAPDNAGVVCEGINDGEGARPISSFSPLFTRCTLFLSFFQRLSDG
jgi:hypothetical protein